MPPASLLNSCGLDMMHPYADFAQFSYCGLPGPVHTAEAAAGRRETKTSATQQPRHLAPGAGLREGLRDCSRGHKHVSAPCCQNRAQRSAGQVCWLPRQGRVWHRRGGSGTVSEH